MLFPVALKVLAILSAVLVSLTTTSAHSSSHYQLAVRSIDGLPIQANHPTILCLDVHDRSGHSLLHPLRLRQLHTRLLHIVFLPATYSSVLHVHLEDYPALYRAFLTSDRCAAVNVTLPSAGRWVVGVNAWPQVEPDMVTVSNVIDVAGSPSNAVFPLDIQPLQLVQPLPLQPGQSYTAAIQRSERVAPRDGDLVINVQLDRNERPILENVCCPLALAVSDTISKQPVVDLLPLLTLPAHLFLFHYNSSTHAYYFHHLHAHNSQLTQPLHCSDDSPPHDSTQTANEQHMTSMDGMDGMGGMDGMEVSDREEQFGPVVAASGVRFECAGRWMIVGQMRRAGATANATSDGELLTVTMDVLVMQK